MKIFGINFNSASSEKKPITIAICDFKKSRGLTVSKVESLSSLKEFDTFLKQKGPWFADVDFPLGQPNLFLKNMNLPEKWNSYIKELNKWKLEGFEKKVNQYKDKIPAGSKEPLRLTDTMAGVESPLKLSHQQLARQFYESTNCLLKSRVSIIPCNERNDNRVVMKLFPIFWYSALQFITWGQRQIMLMQKTFIRKSLDDGRRYNC
jgi:hypothetical protein